MSTTATLSPAILTLARDAYRAHRDQAVRLGMTPAAFRAAVDELCTAGDAVAYVSAAEVVALGRLAEINRQEDARESRKASWCPSDWARDPSETGYDV